MRVFEKAKSASVREHLIHLHKTAADHHKELAGHYEGLSKCLDKAEGADSGKTFLKAIADEHSSMAQFHTDAANACEKATASADLEKRADTLVPTNISAVVPDRPGVRAVPRAGQQPIQTGPNVPLEFSKLVSTEDEEEETIRQ
jgi:hypothetical protein